MGIAFVERLLQGVLDYARSREGWIFTRMPERLDPSLDWLQGWEGDGAFALVTTPADAQLARKLKFPVVNLAAYLADTGLPTVTVDHGATGRLGAEHLLERRFFRFGYYGTRGIHYSEVRRRNFVETVKRAGRPCEVLEVADAVSAPRKWRSQQEELKAWLKSLQPPVGLMASTDLRACMVLDACAEIGWRVPEDAAVIGVDNDPVVCEFSHPRLTSVSRNDYAVGRQAAAFLEKLMAGKETRRTILVAPDGIVQRRSTETLAIDDPHVAAVVQYIRAHLHEPFGVERLVELVPISRRDLEHRFQASLGSAPYALINQLRVERAQQLLAAPGKQTLSEIAAACGFTELRRFRVVFERLTGHTPADYRTTKRKAASP